jgi:methylglutaconyl-CoA hydratase
MFMPSDAIQVKLTGAAGTIVLNRPDHGNCLTRSMVRQLTEALDDLYQEKKVRAIIVTGAGKDFCRGSDLPEIKASAALPGAQGQWGEDAAELRDLLVRMLEITKPIIAAVNGSAYASGAALAAAADIVVAADSADWCLPEIRQGMVAGLAAPLVAFRAGAGHAAKLLLTGRPIGAEEALQLGLFHELTPFNAVWARAAEIAQQCAEGAPQALQLSKRLLYETLGEHLPSRLAAGAVMAATALTTDAAEEGIAAFLEQRPPRWP